MNLPQEVASCAICPRLCRDVCPVAVQAGRDDLVPSEKMRAVAALMGASAGLADGERLLACTDCGACTEHCLLKIPVAPWLDAGRQRWLEHESGQLPAAPPDDPPAIAIDADDVDETCYVLTTCGGQPEGCQNRLRLEDGARLVGSAVDERPPKSDPGAGRSSLAAAQRHQPPMGSTCCGQRLHQGVGGAGLRHAMARAMVADLPDGVTVLVSAPACAAHLAVVVGSRLDVRAVGTMGEDAALKGGGGQ